MSSCFFRKLCRGTGSLIRKRGGGRSNDTSAGRERLRKGCRLGTPSRSNSSVGAGPSVKPFRYSANPASNTPVSALQPLRHFFITCCGRKLVQHRPRPKISAPLDAQMNPSRRLCWKSLRPAMSSARNFPWGNKSNLSFQAASPSRHGDGLVCACEGVL